nr:MAG TPA: hypothetical protein [Bacteriophage sp.]
MTDLEINKKFKDLYKDIKESKDILKDSYIIASNTDKGITSEVIGPTKNIGILLSHILVDNPDLISVFEKAIVVANICIELENMHLV